MPAGRQWPRTFPSQTIFIPNLHTAPQWAAATPPHSHAPLPPPHSQDQHRDEEEPWGALALEGGPTAPYWLQCRFFLLPVTKESHLLFAGCEG